MKYIDNNAKDMERYTDQAFGVTRARTGSERAQDSYTTHERSSFNGAAIVRELLPSHSFRNIRLSL